MRRQKRKIYGNIDRVNPLNLATAAWTQCFVIGAFVNRRLALCVHSLLPGKQRKYYEEALNAVKAVIAPSTPARVISDFEIATIRAMRETFPAAQLTGCLFHMSQAVFRKWREMGLHIKWEDSENSGANANLNHIRFDLRSFSESIGTLSPPTEEKVDQSSRDE
ncbi:hypothetical protein niasHT_035334 [Heterodera trifolii]|uniref:MULE transposase domain-containing protein n=1 Tax=Heterodera trifolii TaxID=157864 RepID=A0ABD2IA76_9BILA